MNLSAPVLLGLGNVINGRVYTAVMGSSDTKPHLRTYIEFITPYLNIARGHINPETDLRLIIITNEKLLYN